MKLTIKSGESIDNALQYLKDFLEQYNEEYPILKGNMNVYVTLKGYGTRICPDNEREIVLSHELPVDVEESKRLAKKEALMTGWENYYDSNYRALCSASGKVEGYLRKLEDAKKKKLTEKTITQREARWEQSKDDLAKQEKKFKIISSLHNLVRNGEFKLYFVKHVSRKSSYDYDFDAYIIFENVSGENYYFASFESRYEKAYGTLYVGLPEGYEPVAK